MKNLIIVFLALLPFFTNAQAQEGKIIYKENVKLEIELPPEAAHMKDMIPSSQSFDKVLFFNSNESIWKNYDASAEQDATFEDTNEEGNIRVKMIFSGSNSQLYKNLENKKQIESKDFMGRQFLIDGKPKTYTWKLTGEEKMVAGYNCRQATFQDTAQTIEAWFTPQIAVSNGPGSYGQLPGIILELNIDDGARTIIATKVDLKRLDKNAIEVPKKGKKVSQEEYDKIVEEKTAEMEQLNGGGGVQIKMRRN